MNANAETMNGHVEAAPSSVKMIRTLAGIAMVSGILLALVYQGTFNRIKMLEKQRLQNAVFAVIPFTVGPEEAVQKVFVVNEAKEIVPLEDEATEGTRIYAGYENGQLVGVALGAEGRGYGDVIRVLYGYDPYNQRLTGFKVLFNVETPGLGDKITKEPFIDNFKGLGVKLNAARDALEYPITLVKGGKTPPLPENSGGATPRDYGYIDAISGATISSTAVADMLRKSTDELLPIVQKHLNVLKEGA